VRVKRLAIAQRADGRFADEIRRHLITLAKPEGQHIIAPHGSVCHLADAGSV
jgi:hypothetical protein